MSVVAQHMSPLVVEVCITGSSGVVVADFYSRSIMYRAKGISVPMHTIMSEGVIAKYGDRAFDPVLKLARVYSNSLGFLIL